MKTTNDHKYIQRAVAPIIATLLMVAISVVGGILIFVFAQGFFTDTSVQTPNIESLEIFGYDARDVAALKPHNDDPTVTTDDITVSAAVSGNLKDTDGIVVYVRNKGASPITFDVIKIFGADYTWDSGGAAATTTVPANQKFAISTTGGVTAANIADSPVLEAGQEATIIIHYEEDTNGKIKIGRPIPVVIVTGNGATFTKQVQNGVHVG